MKTLLIHFILWTSENVTLENWEKAKSRLTNFSETQLEKFATMLREQSRENELLAQSIGLT